MSKTMKPVTREVQILEIKAIEKLTPEKDGVTLNEGYKYTVDGSLPQLADGIAKLAIELDKDKNMGENAGQAFLSLISNYYNLTKSGK